MNLKKNTERNAKKGQKMTPFFDTSSKVLLLKNSTEIFRFEQ